MVSTVALVGCPWCGAKAGRPCVKPIPGVGLQPVSYPHIERERAAGRWQ